MVVRFLIGAMQWVVKYDRDDPDPAVRSKWSMLMAAGGSITGGVAGWGKKAIVIVPLSFTAMG